VVQPWHDFTMRGPILVLAITLATLAAAADGLDVTQYAVVYRAPGTDTDLAPLRADPRFAAPLAKVP
jgi:hypothetical protein